MRVLLDTHVLLWWFAADSRLSSRAREVIGNTEIEIMVSAASAWEIATKFRKGKLTSAAQLLANFAGYLEAQPMTRLPVSIEHALRAGSLPGIHNDPFDRMLIAQAQIEGVPLVSNERAFDAFGVQRVW